MIVRQDHSTHMEQLTEAARRIFPLLCYTDEEIAEFVESHRNSPRGCFYRLKTADGKAALMRTHGFEKGQMTNIAYIIPRSGGHVTTLSGHRWKVSRRRAQNRG